MGKPKVSSHRIILRMFHISDVHFVLCLLLFLLQLVVVVLLLQLLLLVVVVLLSLLLLVCFVVVAAAVIDGSGIIDVVTIAVGFVVVFQRITLKLRLYQMSHVTNIF